MQPGIPITIHPTLRLILNKSLLIHLIHSLINQGVLLHRILLHGILLTGLLMLSACSTAPKVEVSGPIFYPPLPNPPYIQYLATFSSPSDINNDSSEFTDFILGDQDANANLVQKPYGLTIYNGKIFVVDTRGPGYAVFDLTKKRAYTVSGFGSGRMKKPINITIDKEGNRYVTDTGRGQVLVYDRGDRFVKAYGIKGQFKPSDVAISGDKLFVSDVEHHKIHVLSKQTGETLYGFGKAGQKEGEFLYPTNMELANDGNLYISEIGNFRIQVVTQDGKFVKIIGKLGSGLGQFARPKGVAVDRGGNVYVVDAAFENVQVLDKEGKLLLFFGAAGGGPDSINLPTDIEIDYENAALFQKYAEPKFKLEYIILIASQFGENKVNVYGYGRMQDMDYTIPATD